jgi:hypothetical protein
MSKVVQVYLWQLALFWLPEFCSDGRFAIFVNVVILLTCGPRRSVHMVLIGTLTNTNQQLTGDMLSFENLQGMIQVPFHVIIDHGYALGRPSFIINATLFAKERA